MANKKTNVATAASLQTKSDTAIAAFRNLIAGLKTTNEEAEAAKAANDAQIAALQAENALSHSCLRRTQRLFRTSKIFSLYEAVNHCPQRLANVSR